MATHPHAHAPEHPGKVDDEEARARALALLEATHQFPCDYSFTVIAFSHETVTKSVRRAARAGLAVSASGSDEDAGREEGGGDDADLPGYEARPSREGKYLSHRFSVRVSHAQQVLDFYAHLRTLEGLVTIL